jgi:beta-glucanase (GH16 family)
MKHLKPILLFFVITFGYTNAHTQWTLVWSDEFDNNSINTDNWKFDIGTGSSGWGNNELQYYRKENAIVSNGYLQITAKLESYGGKSYTSARMKTEGLISVGPYGKIEARILAPSFTGSWPAFWMLGDSYNSVGWPQCGEIDIMEHINTESQIHGAMHWQDHNNTYASYSGSISNDMTQWHVYSIVWDDSLIQWYVDGNLYHEANISNNVNGTDEFHESFFILLNMAIGGNWPGFTVDESALPATMYIDYVRVYSSDDGTSTEDGPINIPSTVEAENWTNMSGVQTESTSDNGGGLNVGWIDAGDWMSYAGLKVQASGYYIIQYRVASLNGGGQLSADLNAGTTVLGVLDIPNTGGWQNWTTISHTVYLEAGTHSFGIYAASGGWNINWWGITSAKGYSNDENLADAYADVITQHSRKYLNVEGTSQKNGDNMLQLPKDRRNNQQWDHSYTASNSALQTDSGIKDGNLTIYPNPLNSNVLRIHIENPGYEAVQLEIYTTHSQVVFSKTFYESDLTLNLDEFEKSDIYFIKIQMEGKSIVRKLIVK